MSDTQQHSIRRQFLEVELQGRESDATTLQDSMSDICPRLLVPAIEKVLNRYAQPDGFLTIERIEIDAGIVSLERLEKEFPSAVAEALEKTLQDVTLNNGISDSATIGSIRHRSKPENITEIVLFFLEHGTLPWSVRALPITEFESIIQKSWKELEQTDTGIASLKTALLETLCSPTARARLIRQFSHDFLEKVLGLFSGQAKQLLTRWFERFQRNDIPAILIKQIEYLFWDTAFAHVVSGKALSERTILKEIQADLNDLEISEPELKSVLDSCLNDNTETGAIQTPSAKTKEQVSETRQPLVQGKKAPASAPEQQPEQQTSDNSRSGAEDTPIASSAEAGKLVDTEKHDLASSSGDSQKDEHPDRKPDISSKKDRQPGETRLSAESEGHPASKRSQAVERKTEQEKHPEQPEAGKPKFFPEPLSPERLQAAKIREAFPYDEHPDKNAGLFINYAGLVLLHPFLPQFFRGIGIAEKEALLYPNRALYVLHYLATGKWNAPEYDLAFMKVLCGIPVESVTDPEDGPRSEEEDETAALLYAVIRHWKALKNTSPESLRETFLKRAGKVSEQSNGEWLLQVESKGYDVLLDQLPWGISMIRLPWMQYMLHVEWPS